MARRAVALDQRRSAPHPRRTASSLGHRIRRPRTRPYAIARGPDLSGRQASRPAIRSRRQKCRRQGVRDSGARSVIDYQRCLPFGSRASACPSYAHRSTALLRLGKRGKDLVADQVAADRIGSLATHAKQPLAVRVRARLRNRGIAREVSEERNTTARFRHQGVRLRRARSRLRTQALERAARPALRPWPTSPSVRWNTMGGNESRNVSVPSADFSSSCAPSKACIASVPPRLPPSPSLSRPSTESWLAQCQSVDRHRWATSLRSSRT